MQKIRMKVEGMKIKCYLRYKRGTSEVRYICYEGNLACDKQRTYYREN